MGTVIEVCDNGKIQPIGLMDVDADRCPSIKLGHHIKRGNQIDSYLNQVGQYLKQCDNDVEKFQQFLFDYAEELAPNIVTVLVIQVHSLDMSI